MLRITEKQYLEYMQRLGLQPSNAVSSKKTEKTNKYRNIKVYVYEDGYVSYGSIESHGKIIDKFDSVKEYNRYRELLLLEKAGMISGLKKQVPMVIQEAFVDNDGVKQKAIIYKADFIYKENGEEVVEDVKGFDKKKHKFIRTRAFIQKWKLLKALYPEKKFRLY